MILPHVQELNPLERVDRVDTRHRFALVQTFTNRNGLF